MRISTALVFASGFQQDASRWSGVFGMYLEAFGRTRRQATDSVALYVPWAAPPQDTAVHVSRLLEATPRAERRIFVVAYSWGVGGFFVRFVNELDRLGEQVDHAVLIDGVYRPRWAPTRLLGHPIAFRALINRGPFAPRIRIAPNVRRVSWFRQRETKPSGHDVVTRDRFQTSTVIEPPRILATSHSQIDDHDEVRAFVAGVVGEALKEA